MSLSKPLSLSRVNDLILGLFSKVPPSETLDHLVRLLGTWGGSDKFFQLLQYSLKLLVYLLHLRARLRHRAGFNTSSTSSSAAGLSNLAKIIGDSRTLWRIWGLLPIFQWLISLERNPQPTKALLNIERLQGWSMLGYYPLEHLSYLCSHDIIPTSFPVPSLTATPFKKISLKPGALGMWSCRFWAVYVVLQFAHLKEDRELLLQRHRSLRKAKVKGAELEDFQKRWQAYWNEFVVNLCNLPLALHWSTEKGLFKNDIWITLFGLAGAIASFRGAWRATALLSPIPLPDAAEITDHEIAVEAVEATEPTSYL